MKNNQKLINRLNVLADATLIFAAYFVAVFVRFDLLWNNDFTKQIGGLPMICAAFLYSVAVVAVYAWMHMYGSYRFKKAQVEILHILGINGAVLLVLLAGFFLAKMDFSRLTMFFFWAFASAFVILKRVIARFVLKKYYKQGINRRNLLLIGAGELAQRYYDTVITNSSYGYSFLGYFAEKPVETIQSYLGTGSAFREKLAQGGVDEVVIAAENLDRDWIGSIIASCGRYSAKVSVIPTYNDYIPALPKVEQEGTLKLMNVRSTPDKGPIWAFVKRAMDLAGAGIGLLLASPIMLAVAIAVKRCDHGPAIFSQTRVGKNGKEFKMYKFRSMYIDAEDRLAELQKYNQVDGPAFKMEHDPRITKVGAFIRKTSLDELPQLWNILKGDMSLVGPRPPLPREVAQYTDWDWGRLAVKPGLTCYWQISGRSDVSFDEWMKLDLKYVEEQGFLTDVKILFKTVGVVLLGKGAY